MSGVRMRALSAKCRHCGEVIQFDEKEMGEAKTEEELLEKVKEQIAFHRCDKKFQTPPVIPPL